VEAGAAQTIVEAAIGDSLTRLLVPSLKRELRTKLTEQAEQKAISVFARNLENILIAPPIRYAPLSSSLVIFVRFNLT
jgi:transcriptional accessory protein Tex/SPT6